MTSSEQPEVWLRGAVPGYPALLMPIVHALLQVREDIGRLVATVPDDHLWNRPGVAVTTSAPPFNARVWVIMSAPP